MRARNVWRGRGGRRRRRRGRRMRRGKEEDRRVVVVVGAVGLLGALVWGSTLQGQGSKREGGGSFTAPRADQSPFFKFNFFANSQILITVIWEVMMQFKCLRTFNSTGRGWI